MKPRLNIRSFAALFCSLGLAFTSVSFGGGGVTGTGRQVYAFAQIDEFGSIWVNGVEYSTVGTNIVIDLQANRPESALKRGQIVFVDGLIDTVNTSSGLARRVIADTDVMGTLDDDAKQNNGMTELRIHGLRTFVDSRTVVQSGLTVASLRRGDRIVASGLPDVSEDDTIVATRIDLATSAQSGTILRGNADNITSTTVKVGDVEFDLRGATWIDLTPAELTNGLAVRVRTTGSVTNKRALAQSIERVRSMGSLSKSSGDQVEMKGFPKALAAQSFSLNGVTVTHDANTVFERGTAANLASAVRIEVKGLASSSTAMKASRIKFEDAQATTPVTPPITPTISSTVVEFYNTTLKHYFIAADAAEVTAIEAGSAGAGWVRTGETFGVWKSAATAPSASQPVCRFYGQGPNSHFFTALAGECQGLRALNPANALTRTQWFLENAAFFYAPLATGGACPSGQRAVTRFYNDRGLDKGINDANHRFVVNAAVATAMSSQGWKSEGVVFCVQ